ncbi:hypothetical protein Dehly_1429 [Dehalogenimonas lykanthroporepellens BL-DC-9]|nr:hypothetical protein Dehly_1429 [Dehalogenimonas lykanthroporepellens BL-DC-9]
MTEIAVSFQQGHRDSAETSDRAPTLINICKEY